MFDSKTRGCLDPGGGQRTQQYQEPIESDQFRGFPSVPEATSWLDGLTGVTGNGRPNRSVLVQVMEDDIRVDGHPVKARSEQSVRSAIKAAFAQREELSEQARSTYRRHISLAAPKNADCGEIVDIIRWAGAEGSALTQILVQTEAGPGWLPLGHKSKVPGSVPISKQISSAHSSVVMTELKTGTSKSVSVPEIAQNMQPSATHRPGHKDGGTAVRILMNRSQKYHHFVAILRSALLGNPNLIAVVEILD